MGQQLEVGIVGAGIAGLAAAIALTRAGHLVELFEKSRFSGEVGAALVLGCNGTKILSKWGFDFEKAGALDCDQMLRIKADTAEVDSEEIFNNTEAQYGHRWLLFHRADLHNGLRELVNGLAPAPLIRLGAQVIDVDIQSGIITLSSGETIPKDLIIVADGAHTESITKFGNEERPIQRSPLSLYRFMQPFGTIRARPGTGRFYQGRPSGFTTFYKAEAGRPGLMLNTYPVRHNDMLYCGLLHPTKPKEKGLEGWNSPADVTDVIADAKGFHPDIQAICEGATDVKVYQMMWRDPIQTYNKDKGIIIGDAAHLMLSTHSQGACSALEDAMALEVLFKGISNPKDVSTIGDTYTKLRLARTSAVQTMSNKMMGPPDKMIAAVRQYYTGEIPGPTAKTFCKEFNDFFFLYDVAAEAEKIRASLSHCEASYEVQVQGLLL